MIASIWLTSFPFHFIFRPTFRRVIRNKSTEQFSGLPYIYALLNCLISAWYGSPFMSVDNLLVTTVNSSGAVFQIIYITLFITHAEKPQKVSYPSTYLLMVVEEFWSHQYCGFRAFLCLLWLPGEDVWVAAGSFSHSCTYNRGELADKWFRAATHFDWVSQLCFSCINVCFPTVCDCTYFWLILLRGRVDLIARILLQYTYLDND